MPAEIYYSYPVLTDKQFSVLSAFVGSDLLFISQIATLSDNNIQSISRLVKELTLGGFIDEDIVGTRKAFRISKKGNAAYKAAIAAMKTYNKLI